MFSDPGFLSFTASITGLSTGDSSTFILGTDDFEEGETNERGLLFDSSGAPIRFDQPTTAASNDRTMCVSGPTSCDGVTLNNLTRLTLVDNDVFHGIYLDDGTVATLSAIGSGESYTPFGGNWTYFSGTNVGSGIGVGGLYTIQLCRFQRLSGFSALVYWVS